MKYVICPKEKDTFYTFFKRGVSKHFLTYEKAKTRMSFYSTSF